MTANGTHRARGVVSRGPLLGLLGLTLGTPAILVTLFVAYFVTSVTEPAWAFPAALVGVLVGASSLRLAGARRGIVHRVADVAGLIILAVSVAVIVLEVLAVLA
jgi:hypothetical protein